MANKKIETKTLTTKLAGDTLDTLKSFTDSQGKAWELGGNYSSQGTDLQVFFNNNLFPKVFSSDLILPQLGNRFNPWVKEQEMIAQLSEFYVFLDQAPTNINLNKSGMSMLETYFKNIATKIYGAGEMRKMKFSINNNDMRLRFSKLKDMVKYNLGALEHTLSMINMNEEIETKAMIIDYSLNYAKEKRPVTSISDLVNKTYQAILNTQNNSHKWNETQSASGGGRFTTVSSLDRMMILTTDEVKTYMLDSIIANMFNVAGLDLTKHIISFEDLGGSWSTTSDIKIEDVDTLKFMRNVGQYETELGDIVPKGSILTFEEYNDLPEFKGHLEEIKPKGDLFTGVYDMRSIYLGRNTQDMLQSPFTNTENGNTNHVLQYYSRKFMLPFYNKIILGDEF